MVLLGLVFNDAVQFKGQKLNTSVNSLVELTILDVFI